MNPNRVSFNEVLDIDVDLVRYFIYNVKKQVLLRLKSLHSEYSLHLFLELGLERVFILSAILFQVIHH